MANELASGETGHQPGDGDDKIKCEAYMTNQFAGMRKELKVGITGCGLCQTKVPCEFKNPAKSD